MNKIYLENEAQKKLIENVTSQNIGGGGYGIAAGGTGVAGMAAAGVMTAVAAGQNFCSSIGDSMGKAVQKDMLSKGWAIKILYGSEYVYLIKHLRESTSQALYNDIYRSLANQYSDVKNTAQA